MLRSFLLLLLPAFAWGQAAPKEKTKKSKAANALLLASVSGKLTGLSFGALATKEIVAPTADPLQQKKAFQIGAASGWGFAAITGGAAYMVDDAQVKPWMFYTEVAAYGAIGAALGGLAIRSSLRDDSAQGKALGIRAAIFLSASASAGGAAYLLKEQQQQLVQVSVSPLGVMAAFQF